VIFTTHFYEMNILRDWKCFIKEAALWLGIGSTIGIIVGSLIFSFLVFYNYLLILELILGLVLLIVSHKNDQGGDIFTTLPMKEGDQIGGKIGKRPHLGFS